LLGALATQSGFTDDDLYHDTRSEAAEIDRRIQQGRTHRAAEQAHDLREHLRDAQKEGDWAGDAQIMQLLDQIAALD
jgi:hypothetical protein